MVHASAGRNEPASVYLLSEPAIIAGIARATLGAQSCVPWESMVASYDRIRDAIESVFPIFAGFNEKIRQPGGFQLRSTASNREWATASRRANFAVFAGLEEDPHHMDEDAIWLTTMRSHDQYNTTIYALDDRYRGVFGRRDVLFMNEADLAACGLEHGDLVDIETAVPGRQLRLEKITAIAYDIAPGSVGAYYPEANVLVPLDYIDKECGTPSYKSAPVRVTRSVVV